MAKKNQTKKQATKNKGRKAAKDAKRKRKEARIVVLNGIALKMHQGMEDNKGKLSYNFILGIITELQGNVSGLTCDAIYCHYKS